MTIPLPRNAVPRQMRYGITAQAKLLAGARTLARAVGCTMGPGGHTVLAEWVNGEIIATRDGATVARMVSLPDPVEEMGARLLRDAATRVAHRWGDGTTATVVIAERLLHHAVLRVALGANPVSVAEQVARCSKAAIANVYELAEEVVSMQALVSVAVKADQRAIGPVMQAFEHVGPGGLVLIQPDNGRSVTVELRQGFRWSQGWAHNGFSKLGEAVCLGRCRVIVTPHAIHHGQELRPILEACAASGEELAVFAPRVAGSAIATMLANHNQGLVRSVAVKLSGFGDRAAEHMADLAAATGGTVQDQLLLDYALCGTAASVRVNGEVALVETFPDTPTAAPRIAAIEKDLAAARDEYDIDKLRERLGRMRGRIALVKVGAATEPERVELQHRIEDAVCAVRTAVTDGVVPGGGVTQAHVAMALLHAGEPDWIADALREPARVMAKNAGCAPPQFAQPGSMRGHFGFTEVGVDWSTGKERNMRELPDSAAVIAESIRAAFSTVSTLLRADCSITIADRNLT